MWYYYENGNEVDFNDTELWREIVYNMNSLIRSMIESENPICSNESFLLKYLELDPDFENDVLALKLGIAWT